MAVFNKEAHEKRKNELMEKCFECYAENGLSGVGISALGQYCQMNPANLYTYFKDVDDLIIQSTEYFMSKSKMILWQKHQLRQGCFIKQLPHAKNILQLYQKTLAVLQKIMYNRKVSCALHICELSAMMTEPVRLKPVNRVRWGTKQH